MCESFPMGREQTAGIDEKDEDMETLLHEQYVSIGNQKGGRNIV